MRLIDADDLEEGKFHSIKNWTPAESALWQWGWNDAIDAIVSNAPTIDAVPVVRCKDCVYSCPFNEEELKDPFRVGEWDCKFWCAEVHEDDYCSRGKRRKDAKRNNS